MAEVEHSALPGDEFDRRVVAQAWQDFVARRPMPITPLRDFIIDSWRRCLTLGVDPRCDGPPARADAVPSQADSDLLAAAAHTWELLAPILITSDLVFVLANRDGLILDVRGNAELVAAASQRGTAPGYDWSEPASGTNAVGTALLRDAPTIVRSVEHYCEFAKVWDCAASPVRDLSDGHLLGVLDVTSMGNLSERHSLALAVTAAHHIEHTLHARELACSVQLLSWYRSAVANWPDQAVLLLDHRGRVITANAAAQELCPLTSDQFAVRDNAPAAREDAPFRVVRCVTAPAASLRANGSHVQTWPGGVVMIATPLERDSHPSAPNAGNPARQARHPAFNAIVTQDSRLLEVIRRAERMAGANAPILLNGETGTGKELFARAIHACSNFAAGPFVAVNCGLLTKELAASELLGYEAGAFTGASSKGRQGKFEQADGGSLFLDEIGELPLDVQVHLLRVLQDQIVVRVGGNEERQVRVRIIAATHRNLEQECAAGHFRSDLFFRLKILALNLPPLRERQADIELLLERFLQELHGTYGLGAKTIAPSLLEPLLQYEWPGNVRELHGLVESMYILCDRPLLTINDLPDDFARTRGRPCATAADIAQRPRSEVLTRAVLVEAIARQSNKMSQVARELGISRSTLYRKLVEFGIERG